MAISERDIQRPAEYIAFNAVADALTERFGAGSWTIAPYEVASDAGQMPIEVRVAQERLTEAVRFASELASKVHRAHGVRFPILVMSVSEISDSAIPESPSYE